MYGKWMNWKKKKPLFKQGSHYCALPASGTYHTCGVCGARYKFQPNNRTDRHGRPIMGGNWIQISSATKPED